MSQRLTFPTNTQCMGRFGLSTASGLELWNDVNGDYENVIRMTPVTPTNKFSRAVFLEIPANPTALEPLLKTLQAYANGNAESPIQIVGFRRNTISIGRYGGVLTKSLELNASHNSAGTDVLRIIPIALNGRYHNHLFIELPLAGDFINAFITALKEIASVQQQACA